MKYKVTKDKESITFMPICKCKKNQICMHTGFSFEIGLLNAIKKEMKNET